MREAINQNRSVQLALLAVVCLAGGFLLLKATKGSGSESGSSSSSSASAGSSSGSSASTPGAAAITATNPAPAGSSTPAPAGSSLPTSSAGATGSATAVPASMLPHSGAPKPVLVAYKHGEAVALLVVRAGGVDDALVRHSLVRLAGIPKLRVLVTKAKGIARYAWLTQGVDVTELPALVILLPRGLSHGVPTASVNYGFRDGRSVLQAAKDALYKGPNNLPYHP